MSDSEAPQYKVFVGGLTWDLTNDELVEEFKNFNASKAEILVDKMSGRSRGFGFVWFENRKDMEDAISSKNKTSIKDREISVKEAIPENQIPPGGRQRDRYRGAGGRGGDRYGGGYGDRGGYDRGYDRGYGGGGYDRGYGGGYGGYDRSGYGGYPAESYGYGGYSSGYGGYSGGYAAAYPDTRGADRSYASPGGYGAGGGSYGPERGASRVPPRADPYARR